MAKIDIARPKYRFHSTLLDLRRGESSLVAIIDGAGSWDTGMEAAAWVYHVLEDRWRIELPTNAEALSKDLAAAAVTIPEEIREGDSFSFAAALVSGDSVQIIAAGRFGALHVAGQRAVQVFSPGTWVMEQVAAGLLTPTEALTHPLRSVCTGAHVTSAGIELFVAPPIALGKGESVLVVELGLFQMLLLAPVASWETLSARRLQKLALKDKGMPSAVVKVYQDAA